MTPEEISALKQKHYNATVDRLIRVHDDLMILRIKPDTGIPEHKPGQYSTLGLGYWEPRLPGCQEEELPPEKEGKLAKRAYSLSFPMLDEKDALVKYEEMGYIEFYIVLVRDKEGPAPVLTPRLFMLQDGDRIFLGRKITGQYVLDPVKPTDTVLFLATGTGEAPHNYMLWDLLRHGHQGKILSACCVRYRQDLGYRAVHDRLMERYPNYTYVGLTTREKDTINNKVYVQDLIESGELEAKLDQALDPNATHVFLCGNPKMIGVPETNRETGERTYPDSRGVIQILEERGFQADQPNRKIKGNVHYEEYW